MSAHIKVRQVPEGFTAAGTWWWTCALSTCPGFPGNFLHEFPTQSAAMHAALDHIDLYAHENAEGIAT